MPRVLQAFDIFVSLSLEEGLPSAVMEAMGAGLPCVVGDVGGDAEAVVHGETGWWTTRVCAAPWVSDREPRRSRGR